MKHVLISVMGQSPAILTETVYHLCVDKKLPLNEVHVLTTEDGRKSIQQHILEDGIWHQLCADYKLYLSFGPDHIHVLKDQAGERLKDIRTPEESKQAAELIVEFIRRQAKDPETTLHCSVAGGRKTIGNYLAFALQLFGRQQDSLSHILVYPPALEARAKEGCRSFFYPPPEPTTFFTIAGEVDSRDISFDMAEIPFVRLRHILHSSWLDHPYSRLVELAQKELADLSVCLDLETKKIVFCSEGSQPVEVRLGGKKTNKARLEPKEAAYYSYFLLKTQGHRLVQNCSTLQLIKKLYTHIPRSSGPKITNFDVFDMTTRSKAFGAITEILQPHYPRAFARALLDPDTGETVLIPPEKIKVIGTL
ncbi:MAG: TIGR02584 family CRISPR-associated protein [Candidatus Latescibacteria bacterium]|nr:TIGR02584 family CRISPR-associated protein [Candidatus Latescibacterota bacterium]